MVKPVALDYSCFCRAEQKVRFLHVFADEACKRLFFICCFCESGPLPVQMGAGSAVDEHELAKARLTPTNESDEFGSKGADSFPNALWIMGLCGYTSRLPHGD